MRSYAETYWDSPDALRIQGMIDFVVHNARRLAPHFETGGMLWQHWEEGSSRPRSVRGGFVGHTRTPGGPPHEVFEVGYTMGIRVEKWQDPLLGRVTSEPRTPSLHLRVALFGLEGVELALEGPPPVQLRLEGVEDGVREAIEHDFALNFA